MMLRNSLYGYACNKVYSRRILTGLSYPFIRLREDLVFNIAVFGRTDYIQLINCEGYYYLQHGSSDTKKAYSGAVPNIAEAAEQMMVIHPQLPGDQNRRLANILIKQYLCDAMHKYIFMNRTLSVTDSIDALQCVFANKTVSDYLTIGFREGGLFTLLTICMKLKAATLFYKLMRRKWHE